MTERTPSEEYVVDMFEVLREHGYIPQEWETSSTPQNPEYFEVNMTVAYLDKSDKRQA